jgi:hypothetical protein
VAQYLLRDGSQVTVASDPSAFDVLSYERRSGQEVYVVLSVKAERAILKSVDLEPLVESSNVSVLQSTVAVA